MEIERGLGGALDGGEVGGGEGRRGMCVLVGSWLPKKVRVEGHPETRGGENGVNTGEQVLVSVEMCTMKISVCIALTDLD